MRTLLSVLLLLAVACDSGDTGRLALKVTDAPFPATAGCLDQALVTVASVDANGPEGWVALGLRGGGPLTLDLLQLRSGIAADLAAGDLPTGAYTEIRLVVDGATLEFADGSSAAFQVPSGDASGIKVKPTPAVLVAAGQTTPLILDVDLGSSFHVAGQGGAPTCDDLKDTHGKVLFRPVVQALNPDTSAVVAGTVRDGAGAPLADAEVAAFPAGTAVGDGTEPSAATFSAPAGLANAPEGSYAMHLAPGSWDLYVRAQGADGRTKALAGLAVASGQVLDGRDLAEP